ncbi:MAG TPA: hypothetical protein P5137_04165 [Candidatus Brocadiia bacterium]|nr:hypothetical protein [Candidatus Brocadiia bacterium]
MCRRYLLDENNEIRRDANSKPIPNLAPPQCADTPCWNPGAKRLRRRFTPQDLACYRRWQMCRAFKCLPQAGSLADQNPWEMARFAELERRAQLADETRKWKVLAAMLGARTR